MSNRNAKESRRSRSRSPPLRSKVKSKRLLVSNIPFNTSLKDLKDIFKDKIGICGKLDYIERNGKFTGNAIMEFKTLDGAQKAVMEMHKYSLNGREIIVREETNKDKERLNLNQPQHNLPPMSHSQGSIYDLINELESEGPVTNSLFIANLDYTLTWQKLKDLFKTAGRVRHVDLKTDSEGKSRGFGTVEFETPEEAVMAIYLHNNKMLNNREIKLRMDKSGKAVIGGLDMGRFQDIEEPSPPNSNLSPQIRRVLEDILSSITNPSRSNPQAMKALNELLSLAQILDKNQMPQHQIQENMHIKSNFDRNSGYGNNSNSRNVNDMVHPNMGGDNMYINQNFNNPYYRDRVLPDNKGVVPVNDYPNRMQRDFQLDSPRDMRYTIGNPSQNQGSGNREMLLLEDILHKLKNSGNFDQFGVLNLLSSVINKRSDDPYCGINQLHSNSSRMPNDFLSENSSNALLIKNIPFSYTWKDLKHSFSQAPGIVHTEIVRDEFNRSKGIGLVRFDTHADAIRCKNMMDGTLFDGRPIHVEFNNTLK